MISEVTYIAVEFEVVGDAGFAVVLEVLVWGVI